MTPTITLTPLGKQKLLDYLAEEPSETVVRLLVEDDGRYGLSLDQRGDGDVEVAGGDGIAMVVEGAFAQAVDGLRVDYLDQGASSGFSLTGGNPHAGQPVVVRVEETPNPHARKLVLSLSLGSPARSYTSPEAEGCPPAVQEALRLGGVTEVFLLDRFATVTTAPGTDWSALQPKVVEALSGLTENDRGAGAGAGDPQDLTGRLERFIATDVAPFLQRDGGDIELVGFEEGIVKVRLRGACGSCPSSTMTLHSGVERRLMSAFAEVKGLEQVA